MSRMAMCFVVIALFLYSSQCFSQSSPTAWGFKAAMTWANQSFTDYFLRQASTPRRPGFGLGLYAEWFDLPSFRLLTQLEYVQKGNKKGVKDLPQGRVDYLEAPVLGKLFLRHPDASPYILAGPRLDLLFGADGENSSYFSQMNKLVLGASVGGGVETSALLSTTILLEFRYDADLTYADNNDYRTVRNSVFNLWLGVKL